MQTLQGFIWREKIFVSGSTMGSMRGSIKVLPGFYLGSKWVLPVMAAGALRDGYGGTSLMMK